MAEPGDEMHDARSRAPAHGDGELHGELSGARKDNAELWLARRQIQHEEPPARPERECPGGKGVAQFLGERSRATCEQELFEGETAVAAGSDIDIAARVDQPR